MPREMKANPHNWYLDIAYSFGIIGLLPIISLMTFTTLLFWRARKKLTKSSWILLSIVVYIVILDNSFKSTLRQPYPGIFTYFLWGMLLQHLRLSQPITTDYSENAN
jgi:O-antigen ligase